VCVQVGWPLELTVVANANGADPVPREQDPKWVDFVKLCAEEQRRITWRDLPNEAEDPDHDGCDSKGDQSEEAGEGDDEQADSEDEQGSLLFMGL